MAQYGPGPVVSLWKWTVHWSNLQRPAYFQSERVFPVVEGGQEGRQRISPFENDTVTLVALGNFCQNPSSPGIMQVEYKEGLHFGPGDASKTGKDLLLGEDHHPP